MIRLAMAGVAVAIAAPAPAQPTAILGSDASACRADAAGSAALLNIAGLKDRIGEIRAELYPATKEDFLANTDQLVAAGKTFRRIGAAVPATGPVAICVKLPGPGSYAFTIVHQRGDTEKFNLNKDGVGFSNNPRLRWSSPAASAVAIRLDAGVTPVPIVMNYFQGLSMRPLPPVKSDAPQP